MSVFFNQLFFTFDDRIFDKNDDGLISVEELRTIMLSLGEKMTEKELDEMIGEANCDKDGHIDYEGQSIVSKIKGANQNWNALLIAEFVLVLCNDGKKSGAKKKNRKNKKRTTTTTTTTTTSTTTSLAPRPQV
jgi:hypothetical protein